MLAPAATRAALLAAVVGVVVVQVLADPMRAQSSNVAGARRRDMPLFFFAFFFAAGLDTVYPTLAVERRRHAFFYARLC